MIPSTWTAVHRPSDGQHVGYLVPDDADDADDGHVPTSLVGLPVGAVRDRAAAVSLLVREGLAFLDRRWWCRVPSPLPTGVVPVAEPRPEWPWRAVVLVEASPVRCTVRLEFAPPEEMRGRAALPVPVGDLLREHPPE